MIVRMEKKSINEKFLVFILLMLSLQGVLNNIFDVGTIIVDASFFLLILTFILWNNMQFRNSFPIKIYFVIVCLSLLVLALQAALGMTDLYRGLVGFRSYIVYSLVFIFTSMCLDRYGCEKIVAALTNIFFLTSCFGIVQFVFREQMPEYLLTPKAVQIFKVGGLEDLIRVNALLGTTIDYGQICVISIGLLSASIITSYRNNFFTWLKLIAAIVACVLTFSRAAMVGAFAVLLGSYVLGYLDKLTYKRLLVTFLIVALLCGLLAIMSDSFLMYRFSADNSIEMQNNDTGHFKAIESACEYIIEYPVIGYCADFVVSAEIIGDGTFWMHMLQWGIPIAFLWMILTIAVAVYAYKFIKYHDRFFKMIGICFFMLSVELISSSFINSAFQNSCVHSLYWLLGGIVVNLYFSNTVGCQKTKHRF